MYSSNGQNERPKHILTLYWENSINAIRNWCTKCFKNKQRHRDLIDSTDLQGYLFADDCHSCKHTYNIKNGHIHLDDTDEDLGVYQPPMAHITVSSCYESIDGSDSSSDDDLDLSKSSIRHLSNGDSLEIQDMDHLVL